jgi:hypothetical protein
MDKVNRELLLMDSGVEKGSGLVEYCMLRDAEGKPIWAYLEVYVERFRAYSKVELTSIHSPFNLMDYGEVVEMGWGDFPPSDVIVRMQERY